MSPNTERVLLKYKNLSQNYSQPLLADYNRQYCSIYLVRLKEMELLLRQRIEEKWGDTYPICKLHKLPEQDYDKCVVMGTLFKDQKLKPSILKQIAEGNQLVPQPLHTHFTDESDVLFIEDEVLRYQISGNLDGQKLVTGITCALLGKDMGKGKFEVEDYAFAGYRNQIERPLFQEDVFVVFLSGLGFANRENIIHNLDVFSYSINGAFGDDEELCKISRIIIAGNSIRTEKQKTKPTISMTSKIVESSETIDAVKAFDYFLLQLCQTVDVDVMPGENDPSNHILPQKPMHFCMFPQSSTYKTLNQVSNPYYFSLNGLKILGSSGQPVRDITRFSEVTDPLEAMENCLKWNHIAPTAPDTLGCFPYYDKDPFIIDDCPHVMFTGNQPEYSAKMCTGENGQQVFLISIPEFSKTFEAVVLNLKNFDCHPVFYN